MFTPLAFSPVFCDTLAILFLELAVLPARHTTRARAADVWFWDPRFSTFFRGVVWLPSCRDFGAKVGPKTTVVGRKTPRDDPKTFPRPPKSRPRSSPRLQNFASEHRCRKLSKFQQKNQRFWLCFVMLFCIGFQNVSVLCRHKHIFRKCTKMLCFCIVFEDRPFWLQHQIILKFRCKRHGNKLSFSASCGHGFFIDFSMILGSFCDPKSM